MEHRGLNPSDIHKKTGLSRDVVYRLCDDEPASADDAKGLPALGSIIAIADVLGITPAHLLDGGLAPKSSAEAMTEIIQSQPVAGLSVRPPERPHVRQVEAQVNDLEDRVDLLTRGLRQVLGDALDAAIAKQAAQDRQSERKRPGEQ